MKYLRKEIRHAIERIFDSSQVCLPNGEIMSLSEIVDHFDSDFDYDVLTDEVADEIENRCTYTFTTVHDPFGSGDMRCDRCGRLFGEWRNGGAIVEDHHLHSSGTQIIFPE